MYKRCMIDMTNKNALVALAYIKISKNPLEVFCNYILYALEGSSTKMRIDEIQESIYEKLGLNIPMQMVEVCLRLLKKEGKVKLLPRGAGVELCSHDFDTAEFEKNLQQLKSQEAYLIEHLREYVNANFDLPWNNDDARQHLSVFINEYGNAAELFLENSINDSPDLSPSWYIGKYISTLLDDKDSLERDYLLEIVKGVMVYQGIYFAGDYSQSYNQKFRGTDFYLDTKLLLRYYGFSLPTLVKSAQDLVDIIVKEYGGRVKVFQQTLNEFSNALYVAGKEYEQKKGITDDELRAFAEMNSAEASLLVNYAYNVEGFLEKYKKISACSIDDWTQPKYQKYYIDTEGLEAYIAEEHPNWKKASIQNDVSVINQINILRSGNYTVPYGGKKHLPVFVTTNTGLVKSVITYDKKNDTSKFQNAFRPIVTDSMLLARLWIPCAAKYSNLPTLTLARYTYAAQNPDSHFFNELKNAALSYQSSQRINIMSMRDSLWYELDEIIIRNTRGEADKIEDVFASSVDELVSRKNSYGDRRIDELTQDLNNLIKSYSQKWVNKLGLCRILIPISELWWLFAAALLYIVIDAIPALKVFGILKYCFAALPVLLNLVAFVLSMILSKKSILYFAVKPVIRYVFKRYVKKVRSEIPEECREFENDIISYCVENTKVFQKYKEYLPKASEIC